MNHWTPEARTPLNPPQPNLVPRPFRVRVQGHRAVRVTARTAFAAVCEVLTRKGLRYAETAFRVEEIGQ